MTETKHFSLMILAICLWLSLILTGALVAANPPDSTRVRQQHQQIVDRFGIEPKSPPTTGNEKTIRTETAEQESEGQQQPGEDTSGFVRWLEKWGYVVSLVIILVLGVVLYLMSRWVPGIFRPSLPGKGSAGAKTNREDSLPFSTSPEEDFEKARALARAGEFGQGLVVLYRGSIKIIQKKYLVPRFQCLTNKEILHRLSDKNPFKPAFTQLAAAAERVSFRHENPGEPMFNSMLSLYEQVFLKKDKSKKNDRLEEN